MIVTVTEGEQIQALLDAGAEARKSKESARKFLRDAVLFHIL
ncbi:MAG: hypothetical protein ABI378_08295 [Chitinophagaceae bacterium]